MAKYTFEKLKAGYTELWNKATVTRVTPAKQQAELILKHKTVYVETQRRTGVPWWAVGIMHLREAGPADVGRWKGVLHNGQAIVGTGRKTTIVPKGRGPFTSWQDAAYDALVTLKHFDQIKDWTPERVAYVLETFNGFGYRNKGIPSPYLWGGTSVQKRGKYVRDGVYDPNTMDTQIGGMAVLKELMKLDPSIKFGDQRSLVEKAPVATGVTAGTGAGGAIALATSPWEYWPYIIAGLAVVFVSYVFYTAWKEAND